MHVPVATKISVPPAVTAHTAGVCDENVTGSPELALATSVGEARKYCVPGLLNAIVCEPCGVTWFEAGEAGPTPTALAAVTVKMYPMPLVSPVTVQGEFKHVASTLPGLEVTV